jgi:hypothetical protein
MRSLILMFTAVDPFWPAPAKPLLPPPPPPPPAEKLATGHGGSVTCTEAMPGTSTRTSDSETLGT